MFRIAALFCALLLVSAASSRAEVIITFSQVGSDVVAQGSGTINIAGLTLHDTGDSGGFVTSSEAEVGVGNFAANDLYRGFTGPTSFGTAGGFLAGSMTGNVIGIEGAGTNYLIVPEGYTSGTALSGSATWHNTTFSALGLTSGTYTWTWGSGQTMDSFEVIIPSVVPEPSSMILASEVIGIVGFVAWIRRRRAAVAAA
jgi:hypothetical protein